MTVKREVFFLRQRLPNGQINEFGRFDTRKEAIESKRLSDRMKAELKGKSRIKSDLEVDSRIEEFEDDEGVRSMEKMP